MFLPHFDVLCDLLLNRRTASWNLLNIHVMYLNSVLKQSLKCEMLTVFQRYLCSIDFHASTPYKKWWLIIFTFYSYLKSSKDLLDQYLPTRTLRSGSKHLLCVPRVRTKNYGERAFSFCGPKLWNDLPSSITQATSVDIFKKDLKTFLFNKDVNF